MSQRVLLSGLGARKHEDSLRESLVRERPGAVGIAAAYVSVEGVRRSIEILTQCGTRRCRLIAGTSHAVTHPEALYAARDEGWGVRLGQTGRGIFHPKLIVAGRKFATGGGVDGLSAVYVGSSNLTAGGFTRNIECGLLANAASCPPSAATAFAELWNAASPATDAALRNYAAKFAERARRRSVDELADLDVSDSRTIHSDPGALRAEARPKRPVIGVAFAEAAWAGLQSFTGAYTLQVEFPRDAGNVVRRLIGARPRADGRVDVYCQDDGETRTMRYWFYTANGMFRLNIPNDVAGAQWARDHKKGIALVERGPSGGALLRLRLIKPGSESREIIGRSDALGTWGKTPTRLYGWY